MSYKTEMEYLCPQCRYKGTTEVYQSVNVTIDPELKEKVLNFDIFLINCPGCGARLDRTTHMLYHDMNRNLMIQLHPQLDLENWWQVSAQDVEEFAESWRRMGDHKPEVEPCFRTCFGLMELREKIEIFDNELDDTIIELMKVRFLSQNMDRFQDDPPSLYFVQKLDNGDALLAVINEKTSDEIGQVRVPADMLMEDQSDLMANVDIAYILTLPYVNVRKLLFPMEKN